MLCGVKAMAAVSSKRLASAVRLESLPSLSTFDQVVYEHERVVFVKMTKEFGAPD